MLFSVVGARPGVKLNAEVRCIHNTCWPGILTFETHATLRLDEEATNNLTTDDRVVYFFYINN